MLARIQALLHYWGILDKDIRCPYCHSTGSRVVMGLFPKALRQCPACSLVFLHPPVSLEALKELYSQDYVIARDEMQKLEQTPLPELMATYFNRDRDIDILLEYQQSGTVLDLGCSWGFLMLQVQQRGFTTKGVEISRPCARYARDRFGLDIVTGELEDASYQNGEFDAIIASHVLEHIPNLRQTLKEMYRILEQDGIVIIIVPNFDSFSRKRFGRHWKWLEPEWHCFHFTKDFLHMALADAGFESTFRSDEGHYGWDVIRKLYPEEEIEAVHQRIEGSELIAIAHKRQAPGNRNATPRGEGKSSRADRG